MSLIRLIHWNEGEAQERAARLESLGFRVDASRPDRDFLRLLRETPPTVLVIDLSRAPSQGRDIAVAVRTRKSLRSIPLVFVDGAAAKVESIKKTLPDANFTTWRSIRGALKAAVSREPREAPAPDGGVFAGYSGTPLTRKLGIKRGSIVVLAGAPDDFEATLGDLPDGVDLRRRLVQDCDLVIWFVKSRKQLENRVAKMGALGRALWIAWPKKSSGVKSDLTQEIVRRTGLDSGLVDYKICAVDATWSALKFTRRKGR